MNGKEVLIWAENSEGYVYLTTFESPLKPGFRRFSTTTPSEMDRIFAKLNKQEQITYARMTEAMYIKRRDWIEQNRSNLRTRLAQSNNAQEKDFLRAWLKAFDNKMNKLMANTVYGVSAMQTAPAPLPPERKFRTIEDIRLGNLELVQAKPETETIQ
jgi:hypothetical protein